MQGTDDELHPMAFRGGAAEFMRIWWTNLLLTICTLGIYSAWAKVRTKKWFHGSSELAGSRFDYHADPVAILKGRLIVVALYIVLVVMAELSPALYSAALLLLVAVTPWAVSRSLRFNARNSSYRGVRFDFGPAYGEAYFLLFAFIPVLLSLGLAWPWWRARALRYTAQHRFGSAAFASKLQTDDVYLVYLKAWLALFVLPAALLLVALLLFLLLAPGASMDALAAQLENWLATLSVFALVAAAFAYVVLLLLFFSVWFVYSAYVDARLTNLLWNSLSLDGVRFRSTLRARELYWLRLTNLLINLFTLFIAWPVTRVREARYRLSRLALAGSVEGFVAIQVADRGSLGEEAGDLLDLDVGL